MTLSYFEGKTWAAISREERFFCQALFQHISADVQRFIGFLNAHTDLGLDDTVSWEVGYEVCLYRDVLKSRGVSVRSTEYPPKRTFDLCLFSETTVVVIEAKAQQPFKKQQLDCMALDRAWIPQLLQRDVAVKFVALAADTYYARHQNRGIPDLLADFDALLSWATVYKDYRADDLFNQADRSYGQ